MAFQTYQSIREQLVALSVEIDDRTKTCQALEDKVDEERSTLSRMEDKMKSEFTQIIEAEMTSHKENMTKLKRITSDGMNAKKDLLEKCKNLVDEVKINEEGISRQLRKISAEVTTQLEIERKTFRSGHEERQRKYLADKQKEYEKSTLHALEPEFSRLRVAFEQDMVDVTAKLTEDTRRMKLDLEKLYESKLSTEEKHHRDNQRMLTRVRLDEAVIEADQLEREHKRKCASLTEELENSMDALRRNLMRKVKREREDSFSELQESEKKYLDKMNNLRTRHENDLNMLQSEHEKKMREVRSQLEKKKCEYIEKNASNASSDTSDVELNSAEEDAVESLRKELLKKRDTNLKSEIRKIQTENTLADKKLNTRVEEELRRMEEAMHIEEKQLKRKQGTYTDQIAELSTQKNQLSCEMNSVLDELTYLQDELSAVKMKYREVEGIQFKVKQKRQEIEDAHEEQKIRLEATQKAKLKNLWSLINELNLTMSKSSKKHAADFEELEAKHESSLNKLNAEIKRDIVHKDEELDSLRDAVQAEKVKMDRLKKLLAKYT